MDLGNTQYILPTNPRDDHQHAGACAMQRRGGPAKRWGEQLVPWKLKM